MMDTPTVVIARIVVLLVFTPVAAVAGPFVWGYPITMSTLMAAVGGGLFAASYTALSHWMHDERPAGATEGEHA